MCWVYLLMNYQLNLHRHLQYNEFNSEFQLILYVSRHNFTVLVNSQHYHSVIFRKQAVKDTVHYSVLVLDFCFVSTRYFY